MTELLDQGAGDLSAEAFSRRAEELAAHFTFKASRGSVTHQRTGFEIQYGPKPWRC